MCKLSTHVGMVQLNDTLEKYQCHKCWTCLNTGT